MSKVFDSCFATGDKMMPLPEARTALAEKISPLVKTQRLALKDCSGKILGEDVIAQSFVPPHDNSAMDGYAVRFADLKTDGPTTLIKRARIAAGHPENITLKSGECAQIFTGAPVPDGADTIIIQENAQADGDEITFEAGAVKKVGMNLRKKGEDIKPDDIILHKGRRLRPSDIGVCASLGLTELTVYRPLKIAIFSTGDEIRDPGQTLDAGCVYDINRYSLFAQLNALGCQVSDLGILPDTLEKIQDALEEAAHDHDVLFTSGGVSMGEEDHVKTAVANLGSIDFWRIAIKPGRPIALGDVCSKPFIGLPGNPVAALVTFMMLARPMLLGFGGQSPVQTPSYKVPAAFDYSHKGGRYEWQRAYLKETPYGHVVELFHTTGSGIMTSLVKTQGLVEIPDHAHSIEAGDLVTFIPYNEVIHS